MRSAFRHGHSPSRPRLRLVIQNTRPTSATALQGSELKEALLGRIFGYGAVVRSGRLLPTDLACRLAGALVQVAQKKSFLGEVAGKLN